jgi:hypothetical protein
MSSLGQSAFCECSSVHSICIPSSLETIAKCWFAQCTLSDFTFAPGSKPSSFVESAFADCRSLPSGCIPSRLPQGGLLSLIVDSGNRFFPVSAIFWLVSTRLAFFSISETDRTSTFGEILKLFRRLGKYGSYFDQVLSELRINFLGEIRLGLNLLILGESDFADCSSLQSILHSFVN